METNYLTDIMLPLSLAIIMLGMGLSLVPDDFKRVVMYPKAAAIGITIASTLLHNDIMAISPAIYSLIMFMTAGIIIAWANPGLKKTEVVV